MADIIEKKVSAHVHDDGTASSAAWKIMNDPNFDMAAFGMAVRRNQQAELTLKEQFGHVILEEGPKSGVAKTEVLPQLPPYKPHDFHSVDQDHRRAGETKVTHWKNGGELVEYADHAGYVKVPVGGGLFVMHGWGRNYYDRFDQIAEGSRYGNSRRLDAVGDTLTRSGQEYQLCSEQGWNSSRKYWQNIGGAF